MKIIQLSLSDISGGAHRAAYRLHRALLKANMDSSFFVFFKDSDDFTVSGPPTKLQKSKNFLRYVLDSYPLVLHKNKRKFSTALFPTRTPQHTEQLSPDIIHLHWINGGMLRIEEISKFKKPIAWTLHDMWPFTGGCHYDNNCGGYKNTCGKCPVLGSTNAHDTSYKTLQRKIRNFNKIKLKIITPSNWLAECARSSSLFRDCNIDIIPNCLNLDLFKPWDKNFSREILGLPKDKLLILSGALNIQSDPRKGFRHMLNALKLISADTLANDIEIVIAGSSVPKNTPPVNIPFHYLGFLHDEISMALTYSAADIFVAPSEQDNLPNTIVESLACGTPCAAFDIGGMPDMIEHKKNGYLAKPLDTEDLAAGILWMLHSSERLRKLSLHSRILAEKKYDSAKIAAHYSKIYYQLNN